MEPHRNNPRNEPWPRVYAHKVLGKTCKKWDVSNTSSNGENKRQMGYLKHGKNTEELRKFKCKI